MDFHSNTPEVTGQTMAVGGGVGSVVALVSWGELAAITGAIVAVLGLCLQVWATLRRDSREVQAHKARTNND